MAQIVSLDMMENTIRRMTARYTQQQMSSAQIHNYINLAYTLQFPLEFKSLKLTKPYTFTTIPYVDTYDFIYEEDPTNPQTGGRTTATPGAIELSPPIYCQGYLLNYYQDKTAFYNLWPKLSVNQQVGNGGNAADVAYTGNIPSFPFLRAQLDIFGNVTEAAVIISFNVQNTQSANSAFSYALTDEPQPNSSIGNLIDAQGNTVGTVNYLTGNYSFVVANSAVIPSDAQLYASVVPYQPARPISMLFYNQQIVLRPVPIQVFQVEFQISMQPTQLIAAESAPELDEWYLFICCLAAKLIYTDFPDPEGEAALQPKLDEQRLIAQRRSLRQMGKQRVATIFTQQGNRNNGYGMYGQEYTGV